MLAASSCYRGSNLSENVAQSCAKKLCHGEHVVTSGMILHMFGTSFQALLSNDASP